jgi:hypothetical protein
MRNPWNSFLMGARFPVGHVLHSIVRIAINRHVQKGEELIRRAPFNYTTIELNYTNDLYGFRFRGSVDNTKNVVDETPVERYQRVV